MPVPGSFVELTTKAPACVGVWPENSEVFPLGSVAVAVITSPSEAPAPGSVAFHETFPVPSVVTTVEPR